MRFISSDISDYRRFPLISNCVKFLNVEISVNSDNFLSLNLKEINNYGFLTSFKFLTAPGIVVEEVLK